MSRTPSLDLNSHLGPWQDQPSFLSFKKSMFYKVETRNLLQKISYRKFNIHAFFIVNHTKSLIIFSMNEGSVQSWNVYWKHVAGSSFYPNEWKVSKAPSETYYTSVVGGEKVPISSKQDGVCKTLISADVTVARGRVCVCVKYNPGAFFPLCRMELREISRLQL